MKRSGTSTYLSEDPKPLRWLTGCFGLAGRFGPTGCFGLAGRSVVVAPQLAIAAALISLSGCDVVKSWMGPSEGPAAGSPLGDSESAADALSADEAQLSLQPGHINQALVALLTPLPKPLRILTITALPSIVAVQVQNTQNPSEVHQYSYRAGTVDGPQKVKLLGKGSLKDNLFRPPSADPHMAEEALRNVIGQFKHPARKLVMIRNLPESLDIQFRVFLDTPSGELIVAADKHGRVLGPVVAGPSSSADN